MVIRWKKKRKRMRRKRGMSASATVFSALIQIKR